VGYLFRDRESCCDLRKIISDAMKYSGDNSTFYLAKFQDKMGGGSVSDVVFTLSLNVSIVAKFCFRAYPNANMPIFPGQVRG
jgi:hypothetical protein